jgi:hypothetical protein
MPTVQVIPSTRHANALHDICMRLARTAGSLEDGGPFGADELSLIHDVATGIADELTDWASDFRADNIDRFA